MIMQYPKIVNVVKNTPSQPTKFRTKNCVKISDDLRGTCYANIQT